MCCSQVPGMIVVIRQFVWLRLSGIGLLFENCIVDASIFNFIEGYLNSMFGLCSFDTVDFVLSY